MEAAIAKGRALPQWFLDEPLSLPGDEVFVDAFWALSTERRYPGGPIPRSVAEAHALSLGMSGEDAALFGRMIGALDETYLEWQRAEAKRQRDTDSGGFGGLFRRRRRGRRSS